MPGHKEAEVGKSQALLSITAAKTNYKSRDALGIVAAMGMNEPSNGWDCGWVVE